VKAPRRIPGPGRMGLSSRELSGVPNRTRYELHLLTETSALYSAVGLRPTVSGDAADPRLR